MSPETLSVAEGTAPPRNDQLWSSSVEKQNYCDFCKLPGTRYHSNPKYRILKCEGCGLIWTDPLLGQQPTFTGEDVYRANETVQKNRFRQQLETYLRRARIKKPGNLRILEVGSGLGFFLDVCEEYGIAAQGCDLAEHAVRNANRRRTRVRQGTLDGSYGGQNFDAIFAFNLIEHLPHPNLFLADCARALKPGGTLILETPIQEGLFHRIARIGDLLTGARLNFYGMRPSGHIYKFSKKTFRHL